MYIYLARMQCESKSTMSSLNDTSIQPPTEERIAGYKRAVLIPEICQMMFVAGETGEPSSDTTTLVEQIVHEQVVEMVRGCQIFFERY